jgi:CubicO group peptidase (beta-lactamase class C family)
MTRRRLLLLALIPVGSLASGCATVDPPAAARPAGPVFDQAGARVSGISALPGGHFPRADRSNWWRPSHAVDAFSRLDEIWPANRSLRAMAPSALDRAQHEPAIQYFGAPQIGPGRFDLDAYLARNPATAVAVVHGGTLLVERYRYGRRDSHRMTSFSMAKTLIAILIGIAVDEGLIASIDDPAERYVSGLAGSEYGRTPLRHLLTMSSGVQFREDYDGSDDTAKLSAASFGRRGAGAAAAARQFNTRIAEPGLRWYYSSAETYVLSLVLRAAIGRPIADFFSEKIWQPIGAEADASWLTEATGTEVGYMGFNAVLRDYARLAVMLAAGGRVGDRQLIPPAWLQEMTRAHFSGAQTGRWFGYGYQTWIFPDNDGSYALLGVRGQSIFVDPSRRLALVHLAVRPDARDAGGADTAALWRGIRATIKR